MYGSKIMNIQYNRKESAYIATEHIGTQTMKMEIMEIDYNEKRKIVYYNISVCVYNKRKHYDRNFNEVRITGLNPIATVATGIQLYKALEKIVCDDYVNNDWNIYFLVHWEDNRRRRTYERLLTRYGYKMDVYNGKKMLIKKITARSKIEQLVN